MRSDAFLLTSPRMRWLFVTSSVFAALVSIWADAAPPADGGAPRGPKLAASTKAANSDADDDKDETKDEEDDPPKVTITIAAHPYTLEECLARADRNAPQIWAARARLKYAHAQLDEARYTPWFQWSASASAGVSPPFTGTVLYTSSPVTVRNITNFSNLEPFFNFDINGTVPLYTFGKITEIKAAASGQVRALEWDVEKARQQIRFDVRRAYYGILIARDAKDLVDDAITRLDKGIRDLKKKVEKEEGGFNTFDIYRLQVYRDEVAARSGEPMKGERYAMAALRFLTGVQSQFDVANLSLRRPDRPLRALVHYMTAARLFSPDINMARAGVEARRHQLAFQRAKLFPDIGIGAFGSFSINPGVTPQTSAFVPDGANHFWYGAAFGARWNLDVLPQQARVQQAESQLEEMRSTERLALGGKMVEVEQAWSSAAEAKIREENWDRAEKKSKKWIVEVTDGIDLGTADERALVDALRAYGNARINHLSALLDYNTAMAQLAQMSGWDDVAPTLSSQKK